MNIFKIVKLWLKENGYNGLYSDGGECACELSDLQPCGENFSDCSPGIKKTWSEMTEKQQLMCESGCDFYIIKP